MKTALTSDTLCPRSSPTFQRESTPNIHYWNSVNKRREVCAFSPMARNRRTSRELATSLYDMRELWIKGSNWNEEQPGDDPLTVALINRNKPYPKIIFAHISWEGICSFKRMTVPRMMVRDIQEFIKYRTQNRPNNKKGKVSQKVNSTQFKLGMNAGHSLAVNDIVEVTWSGGSRQDVKVTSVVANTVTMDEGEGYAIPPNNTDVVVIKDPAHDSLYTYQWFHLNNPDEWGVGRVIERMKCATSVRNWNPQFNQRIDRKSKASQGLDQWPGEWVKNGAIDPNNTIIGPHGRIPAIRWDQFNGLQSGASLSAILRKEPATEDADNPGLPNTGRYLDFIVGTGITRAYRSTGIAWGGIEYGYANPDIVFESDGDLWLPSPDNEVTDFPKVTGVEDYVHQTSTAPIPLDWMRSALASFEQAVINQEGPSYTETPFGKLPVGKLTTRTNNNSGQITSPSHPLTATGLGDLYWDDGKRTGVTVTPGSGIINVSGGTGDNLPVKDTWVQLFNVTNQGYYFPESIGSTIVSDRLPYHINGAIDDTMIPVYNLGENSYTNIWFGAQSVMVPLSTDEEHRTFHFVGSTIDQHGGGFAYGFKHSTFYTPSWIDDAERQQAQNDALEGHDPSTLAFSYFTPDVLYAFPYYVSLHLNDPPANTEEVLAAGVGGRVLTGGFNTGWSNILCQFELLSINAYTDDRSIYDWMSREASVGTSGFGITNVGFTDPVFAKYGGKIRTWRSRTGNTTVRRYGPDLFTHSTKIYNRVESTLWFGVPVTFGPYTSVSHTLVTLDDIMETADVEVESFIQVMEVLDWNDGAFARNLGSLHPEAIPANYIGSGLTELQIGHIFSVFADYKENYSLFVEHNFQLDE